MTFCSACTRFSSLLLALVTVVPLLGCGSSEIAPPVPVADAGLVDSATPALWTAQGVGIRSTLAAVWGSSAADVYAVGYSPGGIAHSVDRGASWSALTLSDATELVAVGGSGADDVYVAGNRAAFTPFVMHSKDRGTTWQSSDLGFVGHARAIWSSGPSDTYIVGGSTAGAVIAHTVDRGATWAVSAVAQSAGLHGIWGSGPKDVYVAGSLRQDSDAGANDAGDGGSTNDAGAIVPEGVVLHTTDQGQTWTVRTVTPSGGLFAVAGTPDGLRIDAVGDHDTLTESTDHGATWTQYAGSAAFPTRTQLTAVWLPSTDDRPYIASGFDGVLRSIEGVDGAIVTTSEPIPLSVVLGVWGTGRDVFAVGTGRGGVIGHRVGPQ